MSTSIGQAGFALSGTYVCASSFVSSASLAITSESSGYEGTRALSWLSQERWLAANSATQTLDLDLGAAMNADCFGVYKHNFGDIGGSFLVQYSTGSAGGPFTTQWAITPGDNKARFRVNTVDITARYWRLVCSGHNAPPTIGVLVIGKSIHLPSPEHPFSIPMISRDTEVLNSQSEAGEFIGRSILRQGMRTGLKYSQLPVSWARGTWEPFLRLAELNPFFFAYDINRYVDDAYYCFLDKKPKAGQSAKPYHVQTEMTFIAKS